MKRLLIFLICLFFSSWVFGQDKLNPNLIRVKRTDTLSNARLRVLEEYERTKDPLTQDVPYNNLIDARKLVKSKMSTMSAIPGVTWTERGPNNIGGRVRALMFDPTDVNKKKVWAGGVAGGLWYNNDITLNTQWAKVNDFWDNIAITCIESDPSASSTWYVGTGEGFNNIDAVAGGGIWKTTNAGASWTHLPNTTPDYSASATSLQIAFRFVNDIVVLQNGNIIAATNGGILRSVDGGANWTIESSVQTFDLEKGTDDVLFAGASAGRIYKSIDNGDTWTNITPGIVSGGSRVEIGLAPSTSGASQVLYASAEGATTHQWFIKSTNGGSSWSSVTVPDFIGDQGWYDFIIKVHPTNSNIVVCGGKNFIRTTNGGTSWSTFSYGAFGHPDMHAIVFRPNAVNEAIYGSDGGVYYCTDFGNSASAFPSSNFASKNNGLNITQFYSVATKNVAGSNYIIGGAQDNGSLLINSATIASASSIQGGDGMLSFIDQNNSAIQICSYQWNNYNLYDANGIYLATLVDDNDAKFINPADYDWVNNILYTNKSSRNTSSVYITKVSGVGSTNTKSYITMPSSIFIDFIKVANTANTLFLGSGSVLYKLTNINTTPVLTQINSGAGMSGTVSCIEIGASDNELLVTFSNYNVKSVWHTTNGGTNWTSKDEAAYGLPNIPVRYALFNPLNRKQVLLATDLGIWSTNDITVTNPGWEITSIALANVRCDMIRYRTSDRMVYVGTHGRGFYSSDIFNLGCPASFTLSAPVSSGVFQRVASSTITSTAQNTGTADVFYSAPQVRLQPGFRAATGTTFRANTVGCN